MTRKGNTATPGRRTVWNFSPLNEGDDRRLKEKTEEGERKGHEFIDKWKPRRDYLRDPAVLTQALNEYERWKRYWGPDGDEGYYFWLRTQQDQNDPDLKARLNKIEESGRMPIWGIACSPVIYQDLVVVHIGAQNASLVAFDRTNGESRWRTLNDRAQYSAPIIVQQAGRDVLVCWTGDSVAGLRLGRAVIPQATFQWGSYYYG